MESFCPLERLVIAVQDALFCSKAAVVHWRGRCDSFAFGSDFTALGRRLRPSVFLHSWNICSVLGHPALGVAVLHGVTQPL